MPPLLLFFFCLTLSFDYGSFVLCVSVYVGPVGSSVHKGRYYIADNGNIEGGLFMGTVDPGEITRITQLPCKHFLYLFSTLTSATVLEW